MEGLKPNIISKLGVIVLSIVLLTGISFIPVLQVGVYAQTATTITTTTSTSATK